jgi:uncharacterized protein YjbI with pentapeptide repeats
MASLPILIRSSPKLLSGEIPMSIFKQDHEEEANFGSYEELPVPTPASIAAKKLLLGAKETKGDLSGVIYITGTTFWRCQFAKARGILAPDAKFIQCDLENANLWGANIPSCKMLDTPLTGVNLEECNARFGIFTNAVMTKANLGYKSGGSGKNKSKAGIFSDADFKGAKLEGANLQGCNFERTLLIAADLTRANCTDCYLEKANLNSATLHNTILRFADLRGASLVGANLHGADLSLALLEGADLRGANLTGVNLELTDVSEANFEGAILTGAKGLKPKRRFWLF